MKQVITNTWCDVHMANRSEEVHGLTMQLAIDDEGPVTLDLCAECITEFVDPLRKLMATFGQPALAAPPKKRRQVKSTTPIAAAPPAAPAKSKSKSKRRSSSKAGPSAAEVRAWAATEGLEVPRTGRVPRAVYEAYSAAHAKTKAKA
jgi:hypothetical protein